MNAQNTSAWLGLIYLLLFMIAGLFVGATLSFLAGLPFGIDSNVLSAGNFEANSVSKIGILFSQMGASIGTFILAPLFFLLFVDQWGVKQLVFGERLQQLSNRLGLSSLFPPTAESANVMSKNTPAIKLWALAGLILLIYMPCSAWLVGWNESVVFPESLSGVEQFFRSMEDSVADILGYILVFDSFGHFMVALVVVAIMPAIGEEFLFRGILQNHLKVLTQNKHTAVWVAAFIFSAGHMQFYGLIPRMVLGMILGYLYFWSGNLRIPIFVHFLNNGLTLLAVYLYQIGSIQTNVMDELEVSWLIGLASAGATILAMWLFKKTAEKPKADL